MPELSFTTPPPRAELLRRLRGLLGSFAPPLRLMAEDVLGAEAPIDFVAIDPNGRVVLVLVGDEGNDLELVARGLAQRAWVQPRLRDWLQLAPSLGIRPEAGVGVLLLSPSFRAESLAAARALGPDAPALAHYRCVRNSAGVEALVELRTPHPEAPAAGSTPPAPPSFRTGLTDRDLGLTPEERREFE